MARPSKIKPNDRCPCGSGKKFKKCCYGTVNWEAIYLQKRDPRPYLSVRGRNIYFANRVCDILQLDTNGKPQHWKKYKAAFTADAVRKIHEAIMEVWPPDTKISEVLRRPPGDVSGLYIGDYGPEYMTRGLVRHSIYANKILLFDPFVYPASVRDEFNPILNPSEHRTQTLKNVNFWFGLLPWIDAGIVELIRAPSDFDSRLNWEFMEGQRRKFEENEELKRASEESLDELTKRHKEKLSHQQLLLGAPDSYIRQQFEELELGKDGYTVEEFLSYVQNERDRDPDFLEPLGPESTSQFHMFTTGASYPSAKMTANITGSYLFSDLSVKWREIELDREAQSAENRVWAPFAKALQDTPLKYLNSLRLEHALTLRKEGRLEGLRGFLRKVWAGACTGDPFDRANSLLLSEELGQQVQAAETEWAKIDRDVLKMVSPAAVAGVLAAGPLIATGHADFLAAAAIVAGGVPLAHSALQRRSFPDRFPAAFFMKVKDGDG
jgi:SEC-C motif-containing protein